jgi:hypothetical protein
MQERKPTSGRPWLPTPTGKHGAISYLSSIWNFFKTRLRPLLIRPQIFNRLNPALLSVMAKKKCRPRKPRAALLSKPILASSAWRTGLWRFAIFYSAFVPQFAAFFGLDLALGRFAVFVGFFLYIAGSFLDMAFNAHKVLLGWVPRRTRGASFLFLAPKIHELR